MPVRARRGLFPGLWHLSSAQATGDTGDTLSTQRDGFYFILRVRLQHLHPAPEQLHLSPPGRGSQRQPQAQQPGGTGLPEAPREGGRVP